MKAWQGPHFKMETSLRRRGVWPVAGVDEVGRGPLAGPVAAAAVILDPRNLPPGVNDSKALSAKARETAYDLIMESALSVSLAFASAAEIDATDIRRASLVAMSRAVRALSLTPLHVLVDGRDLPELICPGEAIIRGDAASLSIAAASIVAKVARDRLMRRLSSNVHPDFGFDCNAGYATRQHRAALTAYGPTPFHRLSFGTANKAES
jgi:ribonuclease HII